MGMYINNNSKGEPLGHDKVQSLLADGATNSSVKNNTLFIP